MHTHLAHPTFCAPSVFFTVMKKSNKKYLEVIGVPLQHKKKVKKKEGQRGIF